LWVPGVHFRLNDDAAIEQARAYCVPPSSSGGALTASGRAAHADATSMLFNAPKQRAATDSSVSMNLYCVQHASHLI